MNNPTPLTPLRAHDHPSLTLSPARLLYRILDAVYMGRWASAELMLKIVMRQVREKQRPVTSPPNNPRFAGYPPHARILRG
jgi:hypothetical protein